MPVVKYLLCTAKLDYSNLRSCSQFTEILAKQDPEVKKVVALFEQHDKDWEEHKMRERMIAQACSGMSTAACYGPVSDYYDY
jgi:hypothetical protein